MYYHYFTDNLVSEVFKVWSTDKLGLLNEEVLRKNIIVKSKFNWPFNIIIRTKNELFFNTIIMKYIRCVEKSYYSYECSLTFVKSNQI